MRLSGSLLLAAGLLVIGATGCGDSQLTTQSAKRAATDERPIDASLDLSTTLPAGYSLVSSLVPGEASHAVWFVAASAQSVDLFRWVSTDGKLSSWPISGDPALRGPQRPYALAATAGAVWLGVNSTLYRFDTRSEVFDSRDLGSWPLNEAAQKALPAEVGRYQPAVAISVQDEEVAVAAVGSSAIRVFDGIDGASGDVSLPAGDGANSVAFRNDPNDLVIGLINYAQQSNNSIAIATRSDNSWDIAKELPVPDAGALAPWKDTARMIVGTVRQSILEPDDTVVPLPGEETADVIAPLGVRGPSSTVLVVGKSSRAVAYDASNASVLGSVEYGQGPCGPAAVPPPPGGGDSGPSPEVTACQGAPLSMASDGPGDVVFVGLTTDGALAVGNWRFGQ